MIKTKTIYPIAAVALLSIASCENEKNEASPATSNTVNDTMSSVGTTATDTSATFNIKTTENEDDNPTSEISLSYHNTVMPIASVSGNATIIDTKDYAAKGIPENAVAACGSWWAGSGDYFYAVPSAKGIEIFQGYDDEMQKVDGYHWEKVKEIGK